MAMSKQPIVSIIDYGMGNLHSISKALKHASPETNVIVTSDAETILNADRVVFPGVGAMRDCMKALNELNLISVIKQAAQTKPFLGICLGMQLMTKHSEEGDCVGLSWVDATTIKFSFVRESNLKIPHMGWNDVHYKKQSIINQDLTTEPRNYFVHSYYVECKNQNDVLATTHYGIDFISAFEHKNIIGMQFHPEKSHKYGMEILNNFCKLL